MRTCSSWQKNNIHCVVSVTHYTLLLLPLLGHALELHSHVDCSSLEEPMQSPLTEDEKFRISFAPWFGAPSQREGDVAAPGALVEATPGEQNPGWKGRG